MSDYRSSFWKTTVATALSGLVAVTATVAVVVLGWEQRGAWPWPGLAGLAGVALLVGLASTWLGSVALGGATAIRRDSLEERGRPYANGSLREPVRSTVFVRTYSRLRRRGSGRETGSDSSGLRRGEWVEIRTLGEVLATLDDDGTLGGLPFMPEMAAHCGKRARVERRVEKLNDWVHGTGLKRMRRVVLLEDLRCDGSAHGGCQTTCHLRWSEAWLRRVAPGEDRAAAPAPTAGSGRDLGWLGRRTTRPSDGTGEPRFRCQSTELTAGGTPLSPGDPRSHLRELVLGNVRTWPFLVGVSLACFNRFQKRRGGVEFPVFSGTTSKRSPHEALGLRPGERVRVKPKSAIETTLNRHRRNRGLWFDHDMLRFCGGEYVVRSRVERIIDENTGELRQLGTACIVLEGVTSTGEYLGFNPENDYIFWREIWLERAAPERDDRTSPDPGSGEDPIAVDAGG